MAKERQKRKCLWVGGW